MTWDDCSLTEKIEGKQDGVPLIKGTRIPAQQIVDEYRLGGSITEIVEDYAPSLSADIVERLIAFDNKHQPQPNCCEEVWKFSIS